MQMVEQPWGVSAYGVSSVKAAPDLARIRFRVVRVEQTPSEAFATVTEAVRAVRQVLRDHGVADGAVDSSRLDLKSEFDGYGDERRFLGYRCQAQFAVEVVNLDGVQTLLIDLVAAGGNEIDGVDFDVRAKRELRAKAREEAVGAARRKAELYAAAAGVRLGAVLHIEDSDPERPGSNRYRSHADVVADALSDDLAPGHVLVTAAVIVGFGIARD